MNSLKWIGYSCQFQEFRFKYGKLFYLDKQITDDTLQPAIATREGEEVVFVIDVKHLLLGYPFIVVALTQEKSAIFKAAEVTLLYKCVRFKEFVTGDLREFCVLRQF